MDCRTFHRNLEDYLEGGLDFAGQFGMERHAQHCLACGKVVTDAQKLGRLAREMTRVGAPADFEATVLARIQTEGLARRSRRFWRCRLFVFEWPSWRPLALGTLALALLGLGVFFAARRMGSDHQGVAAVNIKDRAAPPFAQSGAGTFGPADLSPTGLAEALLPAQGTTPARIPSRRSRTPYSTVETGPAVYAEPGGSDYVEYLVPGPGDRQLIMRLPKTIRMRYGQPSEEYFIRNVSH